MVQHSDVLMAWLELADTRLGIPNRLTFSADRLVFQWVLMASEQERVSAGGCRMEMQGYIYQKVSEAQRIPIVNVTAVRHLSAWRIAERHLLAPVRQIDLKMEDCRSCRHYVGANLRSEEGDRHPILICGMHPYGPESESCDDWEDASFDSERVGEIILGEASPWVRGITAAAAVRALQGYVGSYRDREILVYLAEQGSHSEESRRPISLQQGEADFPERPFLNPNCRCIIFPSLPERPNEENWRTDPLQIFGVCAQWGEALRRAIADWLKGLADLIRP